VSSSRTEHRLYLAFLSSGVVQLSGAYRSFGSWVIYGVSVWDPPVNYLASSLFNLAFFHEADENQTKRRG
jgi:hypothetical protein